MKGVIFNALFEMIEQQMGDAMLEQVIEGAQLPHIGSYTAAGNYPDSEMGALVQQLHFQTNIPIPDLLETFGKSLFGFLYKSYTHFFRHSKDAFDLLSSVHHYIHVEVKKLYSDTLLPTFTVEQHTPTTLIMLYESPRAMGDLARGLIKATMQHFHEDFILEEMYPTDSKSLVRFTITRV
jgi:hypothetical protein